MASTETGGGVVAPLFLEIVHNGRGLTEATQKWHRNVGRSEHMLLGRWDGAPQGHKRQERRLAAAARLTQRIVAAAGAATNARSGGSAPGNHGKAEEKKGNKEQPQAQPLTATAYVANAAAAAAASAAAENAQLALVMLMRRHQMQRAARSRGTAAEGILVGNTVLADTHVGSLVTAGVHRHSSGGGIGARGSHMLASRMRGGSGIMGSQASGSMGSQQQQQQQQRGSAAAPGIDAVEPSDFSDQEWAIIRAPWMQPGVIPGVRAISLRRPEDASSAASHNGGSSVLAGAAQSTAVPDDGMDALGDLHENSSGSDAGEASDADQSHLGPKVAQRRTAIRVYRAMLLAAQHDAKEAQRRGVAPTGARGGAADASLVAAAGGGVHQQPRAADDSDEDFKGDTTAPPHIAATFIAHRRERRVGVARLPELIAAPPSTLLPIEAATLPPSAAASFLPPPEPVGKVPEAVVRERAFAARAKEIRESRAAAAAEVQRKSEAAAARARKGRVTRTAAQKRNAPRDLFDWSSSGSSDTDAPALDELESISDRLGSDSLGSTQRASGSRPASGAAASRQTAVRIADPVPIAAAAAAAAAAVDAFPIDEVPSDDDLVAALKRVQHDEIARAVAAAQAQCGFEFFDVSAVSADVALQDCANARMRNVSQSEASIAAAAAAEVDGPQGPLVITAALSESPSHRLRSRVMGYYVLVRCERGWRPSAAGEAAAASAAAARAVAAGSAVQRARQSRATTAALDGVTATLTELRELWAAVPSRTPAASSTDRRAAAISAAHGLFERLAADSRLLQMFALSHRESLGHTGRVQVGVCEVDQATHAAMVPLPRIFPNSVYRIAIAFDDEPHSVPPFVDNAVNVREVRDAADVPAGGQSKNAAAAAEAAASLALQQQADANVTDSQAAWSPWTVEAMMPPTHIVQKVAHQYREHFLIRATHDLHVKLHTRVTIRSVSDPMCETFALAVYEAAALLPWHRLRAADGVAPAAEIFATMCALGAPRDQNLARGPWIVDWYDFLLLVVCPARCLPRLRQMAAQYRRSAHVGAQSLLDRIRSTAQPEAHPLPTGTPFGAFAPIPDDELRYFDELESIDRAGGRWPGTGSGTQGLSTDVLNSSTFVSIFHPHREAPPPPPPPAAPTCFSPMGEVLMARPVAAAAPVRTAPNTTAKLLEEHLERVRAAVKSHVAKLRDAQAARGAHEPPAFSLTDVFAIAQQRNATDRLCATLNQISHKFEALAREIAELQAQQQAQPQHLQHLTAPGSRHDGRSGGSSPSLSATANNLGATINGLSSTTGAPSVPQHQALAQYHQRQQHEALQRKQEQQLLRLIVQHRYLRILLRRIMAVVEGDGAGAEAQGGKTAASGGRGSKTRAALVRRDDAPPPRLRHLDVSYQTAPEVVEARRLCPQSSAWSASRAIWCHMPVRTQLLALQFVALSVTRPRPSDPHSDVKGYNINGRRRRRLLRVRTDPVLRVRGTDDLMRRFADPTALDQYIKARRHKYQELKKSAPSNALLVAFDKYLAGEWTEMDGLAPPPSSSDDDSDTYAEAAAAAHPNVSNGGAVTGTGMDGGPNIVSFTVSADETMSALQLTACGASMAITDVDGTSTEVGGRPNSRSQDDMQQQVSSPQTQRHRPIWNLFNLIANTAMQRRYIGLRLQVERMEHLAMRTWMSGFFARWQKWAHKKKVREERMRGIYTRREVTHRETLTLQERPGSAGLRRGAGLRDLVTEEIHQQNTESALTAFNRWRKWARRRAIFR